MGVARYLNIIRTLKYLSSAGPGGAYLSCRRTTSVLESNRQILPNFEKFGVLIMKMMTHHSVMTSSFRIKKK